LTTMISSNLKYLRTKYKSLQKYILVFICVNWCLCCEQSNNYSHELNKTTNDEKPTITFGFLGSFKHGLTLGKLIAGAIPLAVDQINKY